MQDNIFENKWVVNLAVIPPPFQANEDPVMNLEMYVSEPRSLSKVCCLNASKREMVSKIDSVWYPRAKTARNQLI